MKRRFVQVGLVTALPLLVAANANALEAPQRIAQAQDQKARQNAQPAQERERGPAAQRRQESNEGQRQPPRPPARQAQDQQQRPAAQQQNQRQERRESAQERRQEQRQERRESAQDRRQEQRQEQRQEGRESAQDRRQDQRQEQRQERRENAQDRRQDQRQDRREDARDRRQDQRQDRREDARDQRQDQRQDRREDAQDRRQDQRQDRREDAREQRQDRREDARDQRQDRREDAQDRRQDRREDVRDQRQDRREEAQEQRARRIEDVRRERRESREGNRVVIREQGRTIIRDGGRTIIRHDEIDRFRRFSDRDVRIERRGNETIAYVQRPGYRVVTIADENGRLIRRVRRYPNGREVVIIDNRPRAGVGFFIDIAPPVIRIPRNRYIVEAAEAPPALLYETLVAPPVDTVERAYALDEIRYNQNLRERMRRVDLDTVTFDTGSWEVTPEEAARLEPIAKAMLRAIDKDPQEVFLIEGHTDAVGDEVDNLSLSDRRAEAVAIVLSDRYNVPPENLTTQGYGEQYLKVDTQGDERRNRRVTVRRITPLLAGKGGQPNTSGGG